MDIMPIAELITVLLSVVSLSGAVVLSVSTYQNRRSLEAEKRAEIYQEGKIRVAKIESQVDIHGFNLENQEPEPTGGFDTASLLQFATTPEGQALAKSLGIDLSKFLGTPQTTTGSPEQKKTTYEVL